MGDNMASEQENGLLDVEMWGLVFEDDAGEPLIAGGKGRLAVFASILDARGYLDSMDLGDDIGARIAPVRVTVTLLEGASLTGNRFENCRVVGDGDNA